MTAEQEPPQHPSRDKYTPHRDHHPDELVHHSHDRDKHHHAPLDEEYNVFRDGLVRYLGYANEVGESFRYQFPRLVAPSYAIAFGYCLADAATSGQKAYGFATHEGSPTAAVDAAVSTADTLLWQSLASVAIPGFCINQIVKASRLVVSKSPVVAAAAPAVVATWLPTAVGLGSIPLIIHPIDDFVDAAMDSTFRTVQWASYFS